MRYSPRFFKDGLPDWKRRKDPILSRLFYRPVSFYLSSLFCEIGWTANMVSYFSAVVAIVSCAFFIAGMPIIGAILINIWLLLDCADGNIARCVKNEPYGDFADLMSSYICVGLMFACIGYCVFHYGGLLLAPGNPLIVLVGALAGSSDSLMRLLYQKFKNSSMSQGLAVEDTEDPEQTSGINRIRMKVDAYVSLGGFLPAVLLAAAILNALDVVVIGWFAYYFLTFVATALFLVRKTVEANQGV